MFQRKIQQILPVFTKYNYETHWVCCMQGCVCMLLESWPTSSLPSTASTASSSLVLSLRNSGSTMDTGFPLPTCWLLLIMYLTRLFVFLSSFPFLAWNAHNALVILNQRYFKWKRCKFDLLTFCPGFRNPPYIYVPSNKHKCRISPIVFLQLAP